VNAREIARHVPIERVVGERGIKLRGTIERIGPCPICGGRDRFSINIRKRVFYCRQCDVGGDVIALAMFLDGCDFAEACKILAGATPLAPGDESAKSRPKKITGHAHGGADDQPWRRIWKDAGLPQGTPVEHYLARRHLTLPPHGDCLRFHPRCPFGKDNAGRPIYTPAMVALVRNIVTNEPQAIHRTALDMSGRKVTIGDRDRMALGPIGGGAVKLSADADVTIAVGIGEGVESTLSLARIPEWAGSPVWSLLNDNGVANFPVLAGIETLVVAVDHDDAGENAALAVAERWRAAAREVLLFEAIKPDNDLNDVIGDE
jgi:hypothetical protein